MRRRRRLVVAVAALLMVGCGGSTATSTTTSTSVDERARLSAAVRAYSAAYLGGQADEARALLTSRCQERVSPAEMSALVAGAKQLYGSAHIVSLNVDTIAGSLARVTYRYDVPAIDQVSQPWTSEDGQWRDDSC